MDRILVPGVGRVISHRVIRKKETLTSETTSCSFGESSSFTAERWLTGTHQGAVKGFPPRLLLGRIYLPRIQPQDVQKSRGKLFYRLVQQTVAIDPVPVAHIRGGNQNKADHNMLG